MKGRKHCEKRRNCLQHSYISLVRQNAAFCRNGLNYLYLHLQEDVTGLDKYKLRALYSTVDEGVLFVSMIKCLTRNPGILSLSNN